MLALILGEILPTESLILLAQKSSPFRSKYISLCNNGQINRKSRAAIQHKNFSDCRARNEITSST